MSSFPKPWALCGGWAVDAWLVRERRTHGDLDITVLREDQRAIFDHLSGCGWRLVAHDAPDSMHDEPWDGRALGYFQAHLHGKSDGADYQLEVIINERDADEWVLVREPRIGVPLERMRLVHPWGPPIVGPEVILYYKACAYFDIEELRKRRPHDDQDFFDLLPILSREHLTWLRRTIPLVWPGHPWLDRFDEFLREPAQTG